MRNMVVLSDDLPTCVMSFVSSKNLTERSTELRLNEVSATNKATEGQQVISFFSSARFARMVSTCFGVGSILSRSAQLIAALLKPCLEFILRQTIRRHFREVAFTAESPEVLRRRHPSPANWNNVVHY